MRRPDAAARGAASAALVVALLCGAGAAGAAPGPGEAAPALKPSPGATTCAYPATPITTTTTTTTTTTLVEPSSTTTLPSSTTTTLPPRPATEKTPYYLVKSNGGVQAFGGARFLGSKAAKHLRTRFVDGAAPTDGDGYWLATERGNVYPFGDAPFLGSPVHRNKRAPIVAVAGAPVGDGYWLVAANGAVYNYGSAPFCGSPVHAALASPIVAFAPSPDDAGYWLVAADGTVYHYGDAPNRGSAAGRHLAAPIVSIAATADGRGYWLVAADGTVYQYGDAPDLGSAAGKHLAAPIVSITATADGGGYWLTTADGRVFNYGDARFAGSLAHRLARGAVTAVGFVPHLLGTPGLVTLPHGVFGYDISGFQCALPGSTAARSGLPGSSAVSVLQVAGWLDGTDNSCLAAEAAWAARSAGSSGAPYSLYLFVNSPDLTPTAAAQSANGPKGVCATLTAGEVATCEAYNYGFNGARSALAYATSQGVHADLWWLDIEGDSLSPTRYSDFGLGYYWSDSTALNDATIEGALDALRKSGLEVGLYSTSVQYPVIAGDFVPAGPQVPLWVAGVPRTNPPYTQTGLSNPSVLRAWCAGTASYGGVGRGHDDLFAGGVPVLLQETPGTLASPYGVDPDYAC
jgi:hypothetical protein